VNDAADVRIGKVDPTPIDEHGGRGGSFHTPEPIEHVSLRGSGAR
jgi:hypothetical protein